MKILFLILILNLKLFSNDQIGLLEVSYVSLINTKKINEAYSVLKKIIEIKPNDEKWLIELINLSFWVGDYYNWLRYLNKIPIEKIPQTQYNTIKLYAPDIYLKILLYNLKKSYKKDYIYEAIETSLKIGNIELLKELLKNYIKALKNDEKKQIAEKIILSGLIELAMENLNSFDLETRCKVISEYSKELFFSNKDKALKILNSNQKNCQNHRNFIAVYIDIAKNLSYYDKYVELLEIAYKNNIFRVQDAEDLISLNIKNKQLVRDISIKAYKNFNLKHFLYYYISTNPEYIEEEFQKNLDEDIKIYFLLMNFKKLNINEKKDIFEKIKKLIKTNSLPTSYIWIITEKFSLKLKEEISPFLNCQNYNDEETIRAVAYFKSSINQFNEALDCFKKLSIKSPSDMYLLAELYSSNGYFTESYFYKRKAYELNKKYNLEISPRQKIDAIFLFEPNKNFMNAIEKNNINHEEKDILLSEFYSTFFLTEKIKRYINTPTFHKVYIKTKEENVEKLEENINPEILILHYSKIGDVPNTFNWSYYNIIHNPQNPFTYSNLRNNLEKFKSSKKLNYLFLTNKFLQKNSFDITFPFSKKIQIKTAYSKFNFLNTKVFYEREKEEKSISLKTIHDNNLIEISYNNWLKDFLNTKYIYSNNTKRLSTELELATSEKPLSTTLSSIVLLEDYAKLSISLKHKSTSKTISYILFSNYKDMNKKYFATSKIFYLEQQFNHRSIYFLPYFKYAFYNSLENKNIAYNKIFKTQQKILPDEFFELGINTMFLFKNGNISIMQSYNNRNNLNYGLSLIITKHLRQASTIDIWISHFKNYENSNSNNTTIQLSYKF